MAFPAAEGDICQSQYLIFAVIDISVLLILPGSVPVWSTTDIKRSPITGQVSTLSILWTIPKEGDTRHYCILSIRGGFIDENANSRQIRMLTRNIIKRRLIAVFFIMARKMNSGKTDRSTYEQARRLILTVALDVGNGVNYVASHVIWQ